MFLIRRVVGHSMAPAIRPGRIVVARKRRKVRVGDVVVAVVNGREVIKRVTGQKPGAVYLQGDNAAASTDSRRYGWVGRESVRAVVVGLRRRPL